MKHLTRLFVVFMLLVGEAASADVTFVHTDALGSPMAETNSAGQLVRLSHYKAFGEELEQQSDDVGYTGHKYDADLALSYMQARYYDPVIGRFYSNDPVGFKNVHNFSRYAYAKNNPFKYKDPDGKDAMLIFKQDGSIQIDIPINFSGSGATPANISATKSAISEAWSGTYTINNQDIQVNVAITDVDSLGPVNEIRLIDGPTSDIESRGNSFVDGFNTGEWRTDIGGITDGTIAHEAGHLMGIDDKYIGSRPYPGYENNIMGRISGSADVRNIEEALKSNVNWIRDER